MVGDQQEGPRPLPKFYFTVHIEDVATDLPFQEVSGMDIDMQVIEYRAGNSPSFSTVKMPGIKKSGNVTLKRGIFAKDNKLFDWLAAIRLNTVKRATVTIKLLDESGAPLMVWTLANALPTKITGTDLNAEGNEVAVESIELAYEGLTIASA